MVGRSRSCRQPRVPGPPGNAKRRLVVTIAVVLIAVAAWSVRTTSLAVAFRLLLVGGIGNLLDHLLRAPGPLRAGVVDWIQPTLSSGSLNVADLSMRPRRLRQP